MSPLEAVVRASRPGKSGALVARPGEGVTHVRAYDVPGKAPCGEDVAVASGADVTLPIVLCTRCVDTLRTWPDPAATADAQDELLQQVDLADLHLVIVGATERDHLVSIERALAGRMPPLTPIPCTTWAGEYVADLRRELPKARGRLKDHTPPAFLSPEEQKAWMSGRPKLLLRASKPLPRHMRETLRPRRDR